MKLKDLSAGMQVRLDDGFTCHGPGLVEVHKDDKGFYFHCKSGKHYLDGQEDEPGADLVGVSRSDFL